MKRLLLNSDPVWKLDIEPNPKLKKKHVNKFPYQKWISAHFIGMFKSLLFLNIDKLLGKFVFNIIIESDSFKRKKKIQVKHLVQEIKC